MRSVVVELIDEFIESFLLLQQVGAWRASGLELERAMHPLVAAVVFGVTRATPLADQAQPHPVGRQLR